MRFRFFTIPVRGADDAAQELNQFLAAHRILAIDRHLVADSAWAIWVSFHEDGSDLTPRPTFGKRGKVDFKDVLNTDTFDVFAHLRALLQVEASEGSRNARRPVAPEVF